jgi:Protein of unknown function (DUF4233)
VTAGDDDGDANGASVAGGARGQPVTAGGPPPGQPFEAGAPPPGRGRDPARGLRGIGAALLSMHALVVALAIPVIIHADSRASGAAVGWLATIAILDIVVAGLLRRAERACVVAGSALQAATIAAGVLSGFLLVVGVIFGGLWIGWLGMRRSLAAEVAAARTSPPSAGG